MIGQFGAGNQGTPSHSSVGIWCLGGRVRGEGGDGLCVSASWGEKKSGDKKVGGLAIGEGELIEDGRHAGPRVEDMSDAVAAEGGEVFGLKKRLVSNFDGVLPPFWEFFEEAVEGGDEFAPGGKVTGVELGEFEDENAD